MSYRADCGLPRNIIAALGAMVHECIKQELYCGGMVIRGGASYRGCVGKRSVVNPALHDGEMAFWLDDIQNLVEK